jgi:hypothetical protein
MISEMRKTNNLARKTLKKSSYPITKIDIVLLDNLNGFIYMILYACKISILKRKNRSGGINVNIICR